MKPAPSGSDLEKALLQILRNNDFRGAEEVSVFVVGAQKTPVYLLTLGTDAGKALRDLLAPILGERTQTSSTEWVLFRPDVEAILKAARNP